MTEDPFEWHSRRRYLQAASLAGLGLLAGCSSSGKTDPEPTATTATAGGTTARTQETTEATEATETTTERYDQVVDVIEAGADPDGSQSVTPILEEVAADDTLLQFPPGTYFFDSTWRFEGISNLGVVGDRATLVPAEDLQYWLIALDAADFTLAGFTLDHRGTGVGAQVQVHATGQSAIRDLTFRGFHDADEIPLIPNVEDEDGSLLVERLRIPDGTEGVAGVFIGPRSVGKLTFKDCYLENCAQGIYGSPHSGPFYAIGGTYIDNNKAAIRVGAGDHGAHIQGVHVRVEDPDPDQWTRPANIRGFWLREGMNTFIEDCDIELLDLNGITSDGAIYLDDTMGPATIRNTRIRVDDGAYGIRAQQPSENADYLQGDQGIPEEHHLTCEDVRIVGSASRLDAIRVIGRDGSTFRNVTVDQPNGQRRGLVVGSNATDVTVRGGSWTTGHYPLLVEGDREALADGSCPVRLEGVTDLDATNLDDEGTTIAVREGDTYCVDGVDGVEDADEVVVAVAGMREDTLFGRRMSMEAFEETYGSWF